MHSCITYLTGRGPGNAHDAASGATARGVAPAADGKPAVEAGVGSTATARGLKWDRGAGAGRCVGRSRTEEDADRVSDGLSPRLGHAEAGAGGCGAKPHTTETQSTTQQKPGGGGGGGVLHCGQDATINERGFFTSR